MDAKTRLQVIERLAAVVNTAGSSKAIFRFRLSTWSMSSLSSTGARRI
jgi:hypothetical protein